MNAKTYSFVSPTQAKAFEHPMVQAVVQAVEACNAELLRETLRTVVLNNWNNGCALPFTEQSKEGQMVQAAWASLKDDALVRAMSPFCWRFIQPEQDTESAFFIAEATGQVPVCVGQLA